MQGREDTNRNTFEANDRHHLLAMSGWGPVVFSSLFQLLVEEPVQAPWSVLVRISKLCSVVSSAAISFQRKKGDVFSMK